MTPPGWSNIAVGVATLAAGAGWSLRWRRLRPGWPAFALVVAYSVGVGIAARAGRGPSLPYWPGSALGLVLGPVFYVCWLAFQPSPHLS